MKQNFFGFGKLWSVRSVRSVPVFALIPMDKLDSFIPEELMLARIAQSEQLRDFFVQMWRENSQMAAKAGERIQAIMSPRRRVASADFIFSAPEPMKERSMNTLLLFLKKTWSPICWYV